jgi:hypothetical protein
VRLREMVWPADRTGRLIAATMALLTVALAVWLIAGREQQNKRSNANLFADAPYYYVYLPSVLLDRDLDLGNQYAETKNWYRFGKTPIGRPANVFGIGPAVFTAPLFVAGHGVARLTGDRRDGFSEWEVKPVVLASLLYSLGALLIAYRLARRRLGGRLLPFAGVLIAFLGSPVVYYACRQPGYAHPFATFWVALFVERWDASFGGGSSGEPDTATGPRSLRCWLLLGALLGCAALARPQLVLWGVLLVPAVADDLRRGARLAGGLGAQLPRLVGRWAAGAALSIAIVAPQLVVWKLLYGAYYVVPQGEGFMRWDAPAWSETLFASRNGLLPWAPAIAIFLVGVAASARRLPRLGVGLLIGVLGQAYVNGAAWDWWGGGSFGGRRFDSCYVAFAFGAAWIVVAAAGWLRGARGGAAVARLRAVAAAALLAVVGLLVIGTLWAAGTYTTSSARINGGEAASAVLRKRVPGPLGAVLGAGSALANLPARALFAWRHGTGLGAYDRIVGVHFLGETFPGLNSFQPKRDETIPLGDPRKPFLRGLAGGGPPGATLIGGGPARIFVPLNRRGGVRGSLRVAVPEGGGTVRLHWNGAVVFDGPVAAGGKTEVPFEVAAVERGVNELVVEGPPGTAVFQLALHGSD